MFPFSCPGYNISYGMYIQEKKRQENGKLPESTGCTLFRSMEKASRGERFATALATS
jgi:hypothetical protein